MQSAEIHFEDSNFLNTVEVDYDFFLSGEHVVRRREFLDSDVVHRIKKHKRSASDSRLRRRNPEVNYSTPLHLSKVFDQMPAPELRNSKFSGIIDMISNGL